MDKLREALGCPLPEDVSLMELGRQMDEGKDR